MIIKKPISKSLIILFICLRVAFNSLAQTGPKIKWTESEKLLFGLLFDKQMKELVTTDPNMKILGADNNDIKLISACVLENIQQITTFENMDDPKIKEPRFTNIGQLSKKNVFRISAQIFNSFFEV